MASDQATSDLVSWLRNPTTTWPTERLRMRALLELPWCWPREPGLVRAAEAEKRSPSLPPASPLPGRTALLGASGRGQGTAFVFQPIEPNGDARALGADARQSLAMATSLSIRELSILVPSGLMASSGLPRGSALPIAGEATARVLEGGSYGLGFALAACSLLLDRPLDPGICATGTLNLDGTVGEVSGLHAKLDIVVGYLLATHTVLVPFSQRAEAERCLHEAAARRGTSAPEVIGIAHIREAIRRAFSEDELVEALRSELASGDRQSATSTQALRTPLERIAGQLLRLVLDGHPWLLRWAGVARAARVAREALEEQTHRDSACTSATTRSKLALVEAVAHRHDGVRATVTWPDRGLFRALARPQQLRLAAHIVQSWTDSDAEVSDVLAIIAQAHDLLRAPDDRDLSDYVLLGALGRCWASVRRWDEADQVLAEAMTGWLRIDRLGDASFPLCERLRVCSVAGQAATTRTLLDTWVPEVLADPATTPHGPAYVHLAAGRAALLVGERERAAAHLQHPSLESLHGQLALPQLRGAHLRWVLRWASHSPDAPQIESLRQLDPTVGPYALLVDLDLALARADLAAIEHGLASIEEQAVDAPWGWIVRRTMRGLETTDLRLRAQRLADEYPY